MRSFSRCGCKLEKVSYVTFLKGNVDFFFKKGNEGEGAKMAV